MLGGLSNQQAFSLLQDADLPRNASGDVTHLAGHEKGPAISTLAMGSQFLQVEELPYWATPSAQENFMENQVRAWCYVTCQVLHF